jgi:tetratricopeptide (TPR) repeat protein
LPEIGLGASVPEQLSPEEERARLAEATARLLDVIAGERPLLLVIEDIHWSHPSSLSLLHHIARQHKQQLVLATFRDTEPATLGSVALRRVAGDLAKHGLLERIDLGPLPQTDAEALVRVALRTAGAKIRTRPAALAELSEGHPLFMLELTRSLLEVPDDPELPETLTSTIQARVERTSDYARRVLEMAVVLDEAVSPSLLARASGVEPTDESLVSAIEELVARRLLREENVSTVSYAVSHGLIAAVVYGSLSGVRRRALHARAATALDSTEEQESGSRAEALVRHYTAAGELVRAAEKSIETAERAWDLAEPDTAIARYRTAAGLYSRAGRQQEAANAWEAAGDVGTYECSMAGAGDAFSAALAIVETGLGDGQQRARLHRKLAEAHTRWGYGGMRRWERASLHIEQAMALTDPTADEEWSRIFAARSFLRSAECMGADNPHRDLEGGEEDARQAIRLASGSALAWLQGMDALVTCLMYTHRLDEALASNLERIPVAKRLGDAHELLDAWRMAAYTSKLLGDPVAMELYARRAVDSGVPAGLELSVRHARALLADAMCLQGRWGDAVEVLEHLGDPRDSSAVPYLVPVLHLLAAEARTQLGESGQALALIAEAEADPGYDASAYFAWPRDLHERALAAVKEAAAGGPLSRSSSSARVRRSA